MMSHQSQGWTAATEDALSTCSDNSNSEMINPQRRPVNSETLPLRFRNVGSLIPIPAGRKAMVTALGFTLVVITTIVGVTLYTTGSSSGHELEKSAALQDHELIVRDLTDVSSNDNHPVAEHFSSGSDSDEDEMQNDQPAPSHGHTNSRINSTRRRRPSSRSRNRTNSTHGPRRLPQNAQETPPISLLYQMKLVHGAQDSFISYIQCEDADIDGRRLFKGWKATLPVNLTGAGITADHQSTFTGYGKKKNDARRRAAEQALATLYPGDLIYAGKDDHSDIDQYCRVAVVAEQNHSTTTYVTSTRTT